MTSESETIRANFKVRMATGSPNGDAETGRPPIKQQREEFFIHPEILLGPAAYRTVERNAADPPDDAAGGR